MANKPHAVGTGTISGPVPTPDSAIPGDFIDATPAFLYYDDVETAIAVAKAIDAENYARGLHPTQLECAYLDDVREHPNGVDDARRKIHRAAHKALTKEMG